MLLAKSGGSDGHSETLLSHARAVTEMAQLLVARLPAAGGLDSELLRDLQAAAMVHDIGKAASGFQSWLRQERADWNQWRHEVLSAAFAAGLPLSPEAVFAVLTHHKRIPGLLPEAGPGRLRFRGLLPEDWEPMCAEFEQNRLLINEHWKEICRYFNREDLAGALSPIEPTIVDPAWRRADRQRKLIPAERRRRASVLRGMLISADHLASGHSELPPIVDLKQFRPSFSLRPFQQKAALQGNVILRAPTGSGKTEAALNWAARNQPKNGRLFYTLPYTAALNAMHARLDGTFPSSPKSIGLLHGRAAHHLFDTLQNDYPGKPVQATSEASARASLAREMYHSVRVCTPHQLLRYTLRGKGWEQILTEIPGAAILFDEVHSYDARLAGLTLGSASLFHRLGANLMFISATLPAFLEKIIAEMIPCHPVMAPDPKEPDDLSILNRLRHIVHVEETSMADLLPAMLEDVNAGRTVLVVCNHVRSAQTMAALFRETLPREVIIRLFHGRFNMHDRTEIEKQLRPDRLPAVLVATQVVEVSLDISYDCGYFEAAPIDALVQRMGRVNRQGNSDKPPAVIRIAAKPMNPHILYDSARTARTLNLLRAFSGPITEQDLTSIVDEVYERGYEGEDLEVFNEMRNHPYFTQFEDSIVAGDHEEWTEKVIEVENRIDVLPKCFRAKYDELMSERRWLEADELTVNIYVGKTLAAKYIDQSHDPPVINLPYGVDGLGFPS